MAVDGGDSSRIDIDGLVSSIKDMMPHDLVMLSIEKAQCCIYKTPDSLKRHNEKAYIPEAFSIGPLHHEDQNLKDTEKIKVKYLQDLISRSPSPDTMLRTMVSSIMEVEKNARECYEEAIPYKPEELVKILVIDGCFLIELFWKASYQEFTEENDPIFSNFYMSQFLYHDLILLENQVPWMVLEILSNLTAELFDENPPIELALDFLEGVYFSNRIHSRNRVIRIRDIKHFVDLLRKKLTLSSIDLQPDLSINIECIKHFVILFRTLSTFLRTRFRVLSTKGKKGQWGLKILRSATSLVESGIELKRGTSQSILDIKFNDGVLEIPPFEIDDVTETVFRNLISYEQCHTNDDNKITSYVKLLGSLINTAKDIDILCEHDIIDNWLNREDAAQLFNKLNHDIVMIDYYYIDLCSAVNGYCRRRWPRWRTLLLLNYFSTPWVILSTLAALTLLVLTLLQTVYTMKK